MNYYTTSQLAESRRQELTADAANYRQTRRHRGRPNHRSRTDSRRPFTAFQAWLAAGQL